MGGLQNDMCGITGILGNLQEKDFKSIINSMSALLTHRGPDGSGIWVSAKDGVAFGHQRLSIIDLSSAGHQPMTSPCGRFNIVFNGEIYNHLQLREDLNKSEYNQKWHGHSDTETLVSAFSAWGVEKTLHRLVGMFAIAVWDFKEKRLSLIRDRFGEKHCIMVGAMVSFYLAQNSRHYKNMRGLIIKLIEVRCLFI